VKVLVVGGDGMIGSAITRELRKKGHDVIPTSRRDPLPEGSMRLDLEDFSYLPACDVVYLVAAIHTFDGCIRSDAAYRINVDAPCEIARRAVKQNAFPVFVSSDAVEKCGETTYARQKSFVEMVMHSLGGAIVRPSRVTPDRLESLVELMRRVGEKREPGVFRWR
jgi:dTDP-4-dehydrorhamnose reductase